MNTIHPSKVSDIPIDELLWLNGKSFGDNLAPLEPRGHFSEPVFDYATNTLHGSIKDTGPCDDEPERESFQPEYFFIGLLWAGLLTLALVASVARFAEWLVTGE